MKIFCDSSLTSTRYYKMLLEGRLQTLCLQKVAASLKEYISSLASSQYVEILFHDKCPGTILLNVMIVVMVTCFIVQNMICCNKQYLSHFYSISIMCFLCTPMFARNFLSCRIKMQVKHQAMPFLSVHTVNNIVVNILIYLVTQALFSSIHDMHCHSMQISRNILRKVD